MLQNRQKWWAERPEGSWTWLKRLAMKNQGCFLNLDMHQWLGNRPWSIGKSTPSTTHFWTRHPINYQSVKRLILYSKSHREGPKMPHKTIITSYTRRLRQQGFLRQRLCKMISSQLTLINHITHLLQTKMKFLKKSIGKVWDLPEKELLNQNGEIPMILLQRLNILRIEANSSITRSKTS